MKNILLIIIISSCFLSNSKAQDFYDVNTIQEIKITFTQSNWDQLLDDLYVEGKGDRLLANIEINGTKIDSVGIRYKGFSTVSTEREKNPFNIKLDYENNEDYQGYRKIKLSNVFQDPSFVREVLSYEIARNYMPAAKSNFAKLYINDVYWGLYTNVESIESEFLEEHFGSSDNALYKCNPDELDLDGENSNLALSHGEDPDNYKPYYDKINGSWWELYLLMKKLNDNPEDIEEILNVDRTLWMHAFNYVLVNFDSYIGYAQNYYLYRTTNGLFQPILWDLNQSFGSFRITDASENFSGFSINAAKTIDPLTHLNNVSVQPRPLLRNLFENATYKKMYLAHIRTILDEHFNEGEYKQRLNEYVALIDQAVQDDQNKFYSYDDFKNNINNTVTDLVEYPGITELMDARANYFRTYQGINGFPQLSNLEALRDNASTGEHTFSIDAINATSVVLNYRTSKDLPFESINMVDDGSGKYSTILAFGNSIQYYIYSENETAGVFLPARAAHEFYNINYNNIEVGDLVINELLASNDITNADENGDFDDWIEIYNTTNQDISLSGIFLTDDPKNLDKWAFPEVSIPAQGYKLIWADEDGDQGELHANFKLSGGGEQVLLTNQDGSIIDEVEYGEQTTDVAYGRLPNGTGPFQTLSPTPKRNNDPTNVRSLNSNLNFKSFPNPVHATLNVELNNSDDYSLELLNLNGQILRQGVIKNKKAFSFNTSDITNGFYYLKVSSSSKQGVKKIIINHEK